MLHVDFRTEDTRRLHASLANTYTTKDQVVALLQLAGIDVAMYPDRDNVRASWQALLAALELANGVHTLLTAVLDDPSASKAHNAVQEFRDRHTQTGDLGISNSDPDAPVQLLCRTLYRHLGDDAPIISGKLVERIAGANSISGLELFDATRFAIEYYLLMAEDLTPTLLLDVAHGRREEDLEDFRRLLREALKDRAIHQIGVKVEPHRFFSRTLEREDDWYVYFDTVRQLTDADATPGSTLCRIRTTGFVAPQFLVAGLMSRFADDWRPIITEYEHLIERTRSTFVSFQASQWNTWLMWGPSIPICQCQEWEGMCALQYGYGDENNSMPIIGVDQNAPKSLEYAPKDPQVGAVLRRITGRLRWAPWIFRRSTGAESPPLSGEGSSAGLALSPVARAQRLVYEKDRLDNQRDALLFQVEEMQDGAAAQSYFSAYLWLMFLVARTPAGPGQAPRRLADTYPDLTARAFDRTAKRLWRELLPIYVHANIADAEALGMHRRTLVNNAISLLRQIWTEQPKLFPDVDRKALCFCLVGGSDYSGCGNQIRFPSSDPLVKRLRARVAEEPNRDFASSILLPSDDETATTRPPELALFYSTCHLPRLVVDYYDYVQHLKGD